MSPLFHLGFTRVAVLLISPRKKKKVFIIAAIEYSESGSHCTSLLIGISRDKEKRAKYHAKKRLKQK